MADNPYQKLTRQEASDAVTSLGWRLVLGELRTQVLTGSLPLAADVAAQAEADGGGGTRAVQVIEIGIDALDAAGIRPVTSPVGPVGGKILRAERAVVRAAGQDDQLRG
jgi:nucleoid-associated protein YgaU